MHILPFNEGMARAAYLKWKTSTRRFVFPQPPDWASASYQIKQIPRGESRALNTYLFQWCDDLNDGSRLVRRWPVDDASKREYGLLNPFGRPGDKLRIKEPAWMWCERRPDGKTRKGRPKWLYEPLRSAPIHYCADHPGKPGLPVSHPDTGNQWLWRKKLARYLPQWAERGLIEIIDIKAEKLQDISAVDCWNEGIRVLGDDGGHVYPAPGSSVCKVYVSLFRDLWISLYGEEAWLSNGWVWVLDFKMLPRSTT